MGARKILSAPWVYSLFQALMGAHTGWLRFINDHVRPAPGDAILDIGCGPGDILRYLPDVSYWGFDVSAAYIDRAIRTYGKRGNFHCGVLTAEHLKEMPSFDIVTASGVLHHLDDKTALEVVHLALRALKPGGRLVTVDPCLVPRQNLIARFLISCDRGQNVRTREGYARLVSEVFPKLRIEIRHKAWIPYTHCYMECTRT